jgi:16S rRNA (cytidine1402-2'-O)-methyltransferase
MRDHSPTALLRPALYVVPTPIGNLGDATPRAREVLSQADLIAAEDTRNTGRLLQLLGVKAEGSLVSYHDHNASARSQSLVQRVQEQQLALALVSDAGTPGCSDPGFRLIRAAAQANIPVIPLPGPAAFLCALVASGLPTDRFLFVGFLPQKARARQQALEELSTQTATLCLYESPRRVVDLLDDIHTVLGPRLVSLSRELTKMHEETLRGDAGALRDLIKERGGLKGECAVIIQGAPEQAALTGDQADALRLVKTLQKAGLRPRQIKEVVAEHCQISKKEVFALLNDQDTPSR